jgi:hypothetical protein
LANIGITSPILTLGGGGHWMGYSGYVGNEFILNSLGLGRELYYRSYPAWVLPLAQSPRGTSKSSPLWNSGAQNKKGPRGGGPTEMGRRRMAFAEDY